MNRYAQINLETGIIEAVSWISGEVTEENLIPVDEDFELKNKKYVNGEWVEYTPEEPPEEPPTQLDRIEDAVNKSQQDIIDEYTLELVEGGII